MSQSDPSTTTAAQRLAVVPWTPPARERHLLEAVARVHAEHDEAAVLQSAVHAVERAIAGAASAVFQVDPDAHVVSLRAAGPRWRTAERDTPAWLIGETGGIAGFARGGADCAGRWWRRPGAEPVVDGCDIVRVRLMVADQLWGMLVVVCPSGQGGGEDFWFVDALAQQVGLALRHVIDRTSLQKSLAAVRESNGRAAHEDRMLMLARVASRVAHDFNNALTSILGVTEWLQSSRPEDADLSRDLETVWSAATEAAALVRRLQYFARRRNSADGCEVTSLADLATTALDSVRARWLGAGTHLAQAVHLAVDCECDASVEVDATAMREVFVNLLTNAVEASPRGGDIVVRVGREGSEAFAAVVDHGEGMDDSTRGRVFEPFFTTKRTLGAGLGLPLCSSIVESHGGRIGLASSRGVGSTFTVWLPVAEAGTPTS